MDQFPPKIIVRDPGLARYIICSLAIVANGVPIYHMNVSQVYEYAQDAARALPILPPVKEPIIAS